MTGPTGPTGSAAGGAAPREEVVTRLLRVIPLLVLAGCVVAVLRSAVGPLGDPDLWWHLRLGNELLARHSFTTPPWNPPATRPWTPSEPLPEVVAALVERAGGLAAVAWLYGALQVVLVGLWYALARRSSRPLVAAVAVAVVVLGASRSLTVRPQLVSFALLAVVVAAWFATARDGRARWWLIPLSWVWAMCHGFWFIGVGVDLLCWAALVVDGPLRERRTALRALLVPLGAALVVFLEPASFLRTGVITAPLAVDDTKHYISEWQRTDLLNGSALSVALGVAAVVVVLVVRRRRSLLHLSLVLLAAGLDWYAERMVAVAAALLLIPLADALESILPSVEAAPGTRPLPRRVESGVLVAVASIGLAVLAVLVPHTSDKPGVVPVGLDSRLDALAPGTGVFSFYDVGGWMSWRHHDLVWTIDGLVVPYPNSYVDAYFAAVHGEAGWPEFVHRTGDRVALLPTGVALTGDLERAGWTVQGTSRGYVLLFAPRFDPEAAAPSS